MDEREFELRSRSTERLAAALSVIAVGAVLIAMLFAAVLLAEDSQHVADPVAEFGRPTGLELPEGARFVAARDTHGGMHGEGELKIAFDVDASTIERWLKRPAPFGDGIWRDRRRSSGSRVQRGLRRSPRRLVRRRTPLETCPDMERRRAGAGNQALVACRPDRHRSERRSRLLLSLG